ncbi:carbohydrate ABC transporter permease [Sciscionella sediminilitoris]|uniref:carbohydrate ABC transporter permease n=1 Tax=Sciscionella sediminilitoris TaxID=1445613 RepID=UPI0004DFB7EC|nr:sugar ABC transporter permease [Sciscionella sp. SE31]
MLATRRKFLFIVGFLALPALIYVVYVISPYVQAFQIAFTDWHGASQTQNFVGFANFEALFADSTFWRAIGHNAVLLVLGPLIVLGLGMFFAFLLTSGGRMGGVGGSKVYRVIIFLPQVLSLVIVAVLFQSVLKTDTGGMINGPLIGLGAQPIGFLTSPDLALWSVLGVLVWQQVGFYVVLFSAAMGNVPLEIYESARLDGANRIQMFFRITLPLLWDTVQTAWVYMGIAAFDVFAIVWVLTVDQGGPDGSTQVLSTEIYRNAFVYSKFGYASAMGVVLFFVILIFAGVVFGLTRRERVEL